MAQDKLRVVARIVALPGSVDFVRRTLLGLVAPTRAEQGCILYDLMQNNADPTDFTFYEEWTGDAELDAHGVTAHIRDTFTALDGHLAGPPDVRRYTSVEQPRL
jgi:quinol monooxygenase YgiN